jgi:hypothetical protein
MGFLAAEQTMEGETMDRAVAGDKRPGRSWSRVMTLGNASASSEKVGNTQSGMTFQNPPAPGRAITPEGMTYWYVIERILRRRDDRRLTTDYSVGW